MSKDIEPITFSVEECAKYLGVSKSHVYRQVRSGELPAVCLGNRILILRQQLVEQVARAVGRGAEVAEFDALDEEDRARNEADAEEARKFRRCVMPLEQVQEGDVIVGPAADPHGNPNSTTHVIAKTPWGLVKARADAYQRQATHDALAARGIVFRSDPEPTLEEVEYGGLRS
jgi:excisionase family DNA binding protein